jgi:hypothetical protein
MPSLAIRTVLPLAQSARRAKTSGHHERGKDMRVSRNFLKLKEGTKEESEEKRAKRCGYFLIF